MSEDRLYGGPDLFQWSSGFYPAESFVGANLCVRPFLGFNGAAGFTPLKDYALEAPSPTKRGFQWSSGFYPAERRTFLCSIFLLSTESFNGAAGFTPLKDLKLSLVGQKPPARFNGAAGFTPLKEVRLHSGDRGHHVSMEQRVLPR